MGADRLDYLEQMRMGTEARFLVKLRGYAIALRPLSVSETNAVICEVAEEMMMMPEKARNRMIENTLFAKKTLARASGDEDGNGQRLTDLQLSRMTPSELEYLMKEYIACCDRVSPSLEQMDEAELRDLVTRLKKSHLTVIDCSFVQLANICRFLLTESPMGN
jgi:hypothetical protein